MLWALLERPSPGHPEFIAQMLELWALIDMRREALDGWEALAMSRPFQCLSDTIELLIAQHKASLKQQAIRLRVLARVTRMRVALSFWHACWQRVRAEPARLLTVKHHLDMRRIRSKRIAIGAWRAYCGLKSQNLY